ncbi:MAG: tyrosine-type recombinase/integrase [Planctomycetota bacterium]
MVQHDGKRCRLTLGKIGQGAAFAFAEMLEQLLEHVRHGSKTMPPRLSAWINDLSKKHQQQLGEIGLFEHQHLGMTVGELLEAYCKDYETQTETAESTKKNVRRAIKHRMGKIKALTLESIEPTQRSSLPGAEAVWSAEAKASLTDFNSWQRNHYAPPTWGRDNKLLSSIGIWAVNRGLCSFNPFKILPTASMVNAERNAYVAADVVRDAMDSTLSLDIRLTLALGRFAGFRTCSEVRTLKWSHVNWDDDQLTVIDSKKKRPRVMPLFRHVRVELERIREETGDTRFVVSERMRASTSAFNFTQVRDAVERAGHTPWSRLRQNLRTSCENDLLEAFDERLVTAWLGHTIQVSRDHYQKQRKKDYRSAVDTADELF